MAKNGVYEPGIIEENLKFFIYKKYNLCPNNCKVIDSFDIRSPFVLGSIGNPAKTSKQYPDAAYITNAKIGICGECIGKAEYRNPGGKKNDSLAHRNIQIHYKNKATNIYLVQKVLVQLLRTHLELKIRGALSIVSYFSGENTTPNGHQKTLDESEIIPSLTSLKEEGHILNFENINDNVYCKQDITIYKVDFPKFEDIKKY